MTYTVEITNAITGKTRETHAGFLTRSDAEDKRRELWSDNYSIREYLIITITEERAEK